MNRPDSYVPPHHFKAAVRKAVIANIRAAIPAAYAVSPKVTRYIRPWIRDVANGSFTAQEAANSITGRIIAAEEQDDSRD